MSRQLRQAHVRKTYEFIKTNQRYFGVQALCRVLGITEAPAWRITSVRARREIVVMSALPFGPSTCYCSYGWIKEEQTCMFH
jgi:hypothetical protein